MWLWYSPVSVYMTVELSVSQTRAVLSQEAVTAWVPPFNHSAAVTTLLWPTRVFWGVLTTTAGALNIGTCQYRRHCRILWGCGLIKGAGRSPTWGWSKSSLMLFMIKESPSYQILWTVWKYIVPSQSYQTLKS